jgi:hypothetical protein
VNRVDVHHEADADDAVERVVAQRQVFGVGLHVAADRLLFPSGIDAALCSISMRDVAADDFETFARQRAGEPAVPQGRSRMVRTPVASRSALRIAAHLRRLRFWRSGVLKRWKS